MSDSNDPTENKTEAEAPKKPKRKTYYISRLGLYNPGEKGDPPATLTWAVMDGNPRLIARTGEKATEENGYGKITAALDGGMAGTVFELLEKALVSEPGCRSRKSICQFRGFVPEILCLMKLDQFRRVCKKTH